MAEEKTTQGKQHEITAIPGFISDDLITDILLRLPVKSLGRFKSVCKSWNCLISTHNFVKSHLHLSSSNGKPASLLLLLSEETEKDSVFSLNLNIKDKQNCVLDSDTEADLTPLEVGSFDAVGSCHGLIYLQNADLIRILNPITKECREIPFPRVLNHESYHFSASGFNYVPSLDDYKIVFLAVSSEPSESARNRVHIFSLRNDQWRELDSSSSGLDASLDHDLLPAHAPEEVFLLNEDFYWALLDTKHPGAFSILKFDARKETFSMVSKLTRDRKDCSKKACYLKSISFGVIEHSNLNLCVGQLFIQGGSSFVELWMLEEEYGEWKFLARIQLKSHLVKGIPRLRGFRLNGVVFMMIWDGKQQQILLLDPTADPPTLELSLTTKKNVVLVKDFIASLISPHYVNEYSSS